MGKDITINLLIAEESMSDAEALANKLRDAGHKSHMTFINTREALESALQDQKPDMAIWTSNPSLSLDELIATLEHFHINCPVIVVSEKCNEISTTLAMKKGATDMCSYDRYEHLQLIVSREIENMRIKRCAQHFEKRYEESEVRSHYLMESSRDAIAYISEGMHIYGNQAYLNMFGFRNIEEFEGTPLLDVVSQIDHDEFKKFLRDYTSKLFQAERTEFVTHGLLPDGQQFDALMEFMPASIDGDPCTQIIIRNQSSHNEELELRIENLTKQDTVTGLFNRQYFIEELDLAIPEILNTSDNGTLLYLLIDNFRDIRDNVGISIVDKIITEIAGIIKEHTEKTDLVARFGDHTFSILRRGADEEAMQELAEELRHTIEEHIADINNQSITTTCSIGIVQINKHTTSSQDALSRADLACEVARTSGGNKVHIHNPIVDEEIGKARNQQTHNLIQDALDNDLFKLMFQPIVSLQGDTRENYEILIRMLDNDGELILPAQFMPVADEAGLLGAIDHWVIKNAINLLAERRRQDNHTRFFIKLAADSLLDTNLTTYILQCLQDTKLPGDAVTFEISEKIASQHLKQAQSFIHTVNQWHCNTLLSHFGKSPNSFQILKHLPINFIKIDGSFMHNLASNKENQTAVKSMLEQARALDKQCIAAFVQDAHSLAVLWQNGINYIQGNFLREATDSLDYDFTSEIS
ncbi:MAG: EAL domain-containing protein [Gammaproteobacteria bacterium]